MYASVPGTEQRPAALVTKNSAGAGNSMRLWRGSPRDGVPWRGGSRRRCSTSRARADADISGGPEADAQTSQEAGPRADCHRDRRSCDYIPAAFAELGLAAYPSEA